MYYLSIYLSYISNVTVTTYYYTLSLHDALPISTSWPDCASSAGSAASAPSDVTTPSSRRAPGPPAFRPVSGRLSSRQSVCSRSEEHTSELQSQSNLVCRLLLEKKKTKV